MNESKAHQNSPLSRQSNLQVDRVLHRTYPLIACRRTTLQRYLEVTVGDNTHKHDNYRVKSRTLGYRLVTPTQDVRFGYNVPCTSLNLFLLAVMAVVLSSCLSGLRDGLLSESVMTGQHSFTMSRRTKKKINQPNTCVMTGQHSFTMSHGTKNKSTQHLCDDGTAFVYNEPRNQEQLNRILVSDV